MKSPFIGDFPMFSYGLRQVFQPLDPPLFFFLKRAEFHRCYDSADRCPDSYSGSCRSAVKTLHPCGHGFSVVTFRPEKNGWVWAWMVYQQILIRIEQKSRTHEAGCWMAFRDFFVAFRFRESQMMKYDEIWLNAASLELSSTADRELRLTSGSGQVPELGESPSPARDNMCLICVLVDGDWNHGILWLSMYWECHHPNWLSLHHFSEGLVETTNQWTIACYKLFYKHTCCYMNCLNLPGDDPSPKKKICGQEVVQCCDPEIGFRSQGPLGEGLTG